MSEEQSELRRLFADEWEVRLQEDPLFASYAGDHRYDDRLPEVTEDAYQRQASQARAFLRRLQTIDYESLSQADRLNYDLFKRELEDRLAELVFGVFYMPVGKIFGPQVYLPDLTQILPFATAQDYENYISRLEAMYDFLLDHVGLMRAGMKLGYLPPKVALEGIEKSLVSHTDPEAAAGLFLEHFERFPATLGESERDHLKKRAREALAGSVVPGFRELLKFLVGEYIPAARQDIAAAALPQGREFYQHRVRMYVSYAITPEEVHKIGLDEVRRIRAEMDGVMHQVGFEGDLQHFLEHLRTDPRFYVHEPKELLKEVALILKRMDGELPHLFSKLPRTPYGIREIPDFIAPHTTTAYYFPPPGDGTSAGYYYVNTYDLKSRPLFEYEALSLHEAVPGHHLQLALQLELEDVPAFRRYLDATAFIEGWALYSERLGLEVGFYQDPYSNFGRLCYEMWRAARLVVDTGMHALGWTRQQAIDYMATNTALSTLNISNEVDRYIAWPGQALAYKMGEIKIRQLRADSEQKMGERFNVREFHRVLLENGGIPLSILEKNVNDFISS